LVPDDVTVLLIGLEEDLDEELALEEGFTIQHADDVEAEAQDPPPDAVVVSLGGRGPLEVLGALRARLPDAAVVVLTQPGQETDGTVAMHAGAEDHLVAGSIPPGLLPRAVRYAISMRVLHRELATQDKVTGLLNLRGFVPIAEHHLRMADRAGLSVVFLFLRLDSFEDVARSLGGERADDLARDAAEVLLQAVRDSDLPARIASDTFCVLLTGGAEGAETMVLSRLVEAIAVHDARRDRPRELTVSVGSAIYDPERPATLEQILETAGRRMTAQSAARSSGGA
jgi:two-component system, cell cycle response regulator